MSSYTEELGEEICERMRSGKSLLQVCAMPDMPDKSTVLRWVRKMPEFAARYDEARQDLLEHWADQIVEIADAGSEDVNRDRLSVDTRKWIMSKLAPKRFGDRQQIEHEVGESLEAMILKSMKGPE